MRTSSFFKIVFFLSIAAIFLGNVHLPYTVPLSMLISMLFVLRMSRLKPSLPSVLLLCVLLPGLLNLLLAGYVDTQRDWFIYLPLCYALFVVSFAGGFSYDEKFQYAVLIGTLILCVWIFFAVSWGFGDGTGYYALKLHAETPLGRSNYLAVFIGFALLVSTFWSGWASLLLIPALLLTLSRTGIALVLVFLLIRFMRSRRYWRLALVMALAFVGASYYFADQIYDFLDYELHGALSPDSVKVRWTAWVATLELIARNPWFGVPRSFYKDALDVAAPGKDLWDPHNSVLHVLVSFGVIGLMFYGAYIAIVYREIYRAGLTDRFWRGVSWGYSLVLVWSLFEPILLTPAIELLQAHLLIMARSYTIARRLDRPESADRAQHTLVPRALPGAK